MHLDSLNLAERQLLSRVKQIAGLMEEKHEQLQRSGLFGEYGKIYEVYAELIGSESQGLEALKRATFLYWYHTTEPPCFSGLYELSENVSRKVLGTLERKIEAGELDSELKWMLPYYNMIAEWAFLPYTDLVHLQSFLAQADAGLWEGAEVRAEDFTGRGQMGNYWLSIVESNTTRFGKGAS